MKAADFILIQVNKKDSFYELARVRPYLTEDDNWDKERGYYCEGFGQNNGEIYEFSLHLGKDETDIKHKFVNLEYPAINTIAKLKINCMRAKLLRKLTGRFVIQKRNNEYRAFDHLEKAGGVFDCSKWGSYEEAVLIRRKWILAEARLNHKNPKSINY